MKSNFTLATILFSLAISNEGYAGKVLLRESQIIRNVEESVFKTVRLMVFHTESSTALKQSDMQNLISAFGSDQKISKSEKAVLDQLQGDAATFAIENPQTKALLIVNKTIEPQATAALQFFWDRMNLASNERDMVANYLYMHLPGRFFEYYYFNADKEEEMVSILNEYMDYVCRNSDKETWSSLRDELNRMYSQINIGNKNKEDIYKKMVLTAYDATRERYDSPKMNLAFIND